MRVLPVEPRLSGRRYAGRPREVKTVGTQCRDPFRHDGIDVASVATTLTGNLAARNANLGIERCPA
jgi:hypothetical protein